MDTAAARALSGLIAEIGEDFAQARDTGQLWRRLHGRLERFGISEMIYGAEAMPDPEKEVSPIFNSINPSWLEDKLSNGLFECDEYVRSARVDIAPMLWSDMGFIESMSEMARKSFQLDVDYNVLTGVSIPMRFAGTLGASSIGLHAKGLTLAEFDRIWSEFSPTIIATVNAFDAVLRGRHAGEIFPLSTRERDCLLWLAAGLSQKQVADRLRLTDKQVEKRLASARAKLKAVTTTQAVAVALIFGLVSP